VSGFVAVFDPIGAPIEVAHMDAMFDRIAHRGPDLREAYVTLGFGCVAGVLRAKPSSLNESSPFERAEDCLAILDGRLDDRDELARALALDATPPTDGALVLAAYAQHGDAFAASLKGDFAAIVLDERRNVLLAARDGLGVRPMFFAEVAGTFIVASESKAFLGHPNFACEPNLDLLAEVLLHGSARATTWDWFFDGARAVAPGVTVRFGESGTACRTHWSLDPSELLVMRRYEDYVDAFRSLFEQAVARRLAAIGPVAIRVSGGIDSSAIFSTAHRLVHEGKVDAEIKGYTWTFQRGSNADEIEYVEDLERALNVEVERIPMRYAQVVDSATEQVYVREAPSLDAGWGGFVDLVERTKLDGSRVQLSGYWGDQLLMGFGYMADLARRGRVRDLYEHILGQSRWDPDGRSWRWTARQAMSEVARWDIPEALVPLVRMMRAQSSRSDNRWLSPTLKTLADRPPTRAPSAGRRGRAHARSVAMRLGSPYSLHSITKEGLVAGRCGYELWMPMLDADLVRFVASIPGDVVARGGRSRALLRDALRDSLPQPIRDRRSKGDGVGSVSDALVDQWDILERYISDGAQQGWMTELGGDALRHGLEGLRPRLQDARDFTPGAELLSLAGLVAWAHRWGPPTEQG
jgi:asparagine synthase (glutamine-hydrolysing)